MAQNNSYLLLIFNILYVLFTPLILLCFIFIPKKKDRLIWGPDPLISNKYWSEAMKRAGYASQTVMSEYYSINRREDYDVYYDDMIPRWIRLKPLRKALGPLFGFLYMIRHAKIVHLPLSGGPLGISVLWKLEAHLFRWAGIKTVLIPYGSDAYMYSQIIDLSLRNGLLLSYPDAARKEASIAKRVHYWVKHADAMVTGIMMDGIGRWDVASPSVLMIDTSEWKGKEEYSMTDGRNGPVRVMHTPNHRGFKGTEFLIQATDELVQEGLQIELVLLEKVPNDRVRELMQEVDILAEQFIVGYAMSALEGMASGLPVLSNLDNEAYTRVFRRYSFLNECPILSTSPETIKDHLRALVTHPQLRKDLGEAGRKYVEKYHSYDTAKYLFGSIYRVILDGEDIDLMNLFHPLKSAYVKATPRVVHPLQENRLPEEYLKST